MRVTIEGVRHHKCDWCRNDFTETGEDHLTLELGKRSGIASNKTDLPGWRIPVLFRPQQVHFCINLDNEVSSCLSHWLEVVIRNEPKEYVL